MHSSILKGWVGRGALSLALLAGAVAVFLMSGGLGEGQERCDEDYCIEYPEHGSGAVIVLTAVDPEEKGVTWTKSSDGSTSPDEGDFEINDGRLTFAEIPDFEAPVDAASPFNVYLVAIDAEDAAASDALTRTTTPRAVTKTLKVTVTNVDEAGVVTLTTLQPQESIAITATLTDADGKPRTAPLTAAVPEADKTLTNERTTKWQWSRSTRATGGWTDIEDDDPDTSNVDEGATAKMPAYTPRQADVGMYLRATATYDDGEGKGKSAEAISANPVQADPSNKASQVPG